MAGLVLVLAPGSASGWAGGQAATGTPGQTVVSAMTRRAGVRRPGLGRSVPADDEHGGCAGRRRQAVAAPRLPGLAYGLGPRGHRDHLLWRALLLLRRVLAADAAEPGVRPGHLDRSEEHTSELQSLR